MDTLTKKQSAANKIKQVSRDHAVIDYHVTGNGTVTLLFVHGSYIDQTYWNEQVNYFSPIYKVVTMDLPGHGKSGKDRKHWSVAGFAEDVVILIKELDVKNVILIGHSIGGDINLLAATAYPQPLIGFISIDIFKNAGMPLPAQFQQQADTILENLKTNFADTNEQYARMALLTKETPAVITDRVVKDYRNALRPMGEATMPEIFRMYETERKWLPKLTLPLHLINVDYMPTNEDALKKYTANGYEVQHMKGTCHYPMLEHPDKLNTLLQQVIKKIVQDKK